MPLGRRAPRVSYHTPPPVRIGRTLLNVPRMRVETIDGTRVERQAIRNPVQVGSVVTLQNPYARQEFMDWRVGTLHGRNWMPRVHHTTLALVTNISPDRRLFAWKVLISGRTQAWDTLDDGSLRPRARDLLPSGEPPTYMRYNYSSAVVRRGPDFPIQPAEFSAYITGPLETAGENVARMSHVRRVIDPRSLHPGALQRLRQLARSHLVSNLDNRLTTAANALIPDGRFKFAGGAMTRELARAHRLAEVGQPTIREHIIQARKALEQGDVHRAREKFTYAQAKVNDYINRMYGGNDLYSERARRAAEGLARAIAGDAWRVESHACGHTTFDPPVGPTRNRYEVGVGHSPTTGNMTLGSVCPHCGDHYVHPYESRDYNGPICTTLMGDAYRWSDNVYRPGREPSIIGNYHSSKSVVGYIKPLVEHKGDWPTVGFELEVQQRGETSMDDSARLMRRLTSEAMGVSGPNSRKYLNFEFDGSVDDGFEAVSGWTDLATHAKIMKHVLLDENGHNRWAGKLRSHNASCSCGLHVHIAKPKSLVHAAKVRYFMSSPIFKDLVKAVARRYDVNYARVAGKNNSRQVGGVAHCDFHNPEKCAARYIKDHRYAGTRDKKGEAKKLIKSMMLNEDRYEHANFHNEHTIEFRVFRGTTVYRTFMACLELTQAVWMYCRDTPATAMSVDSFLAFINQPAMSKDTRNLRLHLASKGFKARVPRPPKGAVLVVEAEEESSPA